MMDLWDKETHELIDELRKRGYEAVPITYRTNLDWNRASPKASVNTEAFEWEAVHRIARMIEPGHLKFTKREQGDHVILTGRLSFL